MEEPKDTSSKSLCGRNSLHNPRVSQVLFKRDGICLQSHSVYQRFFSPRQCNSLSLKWNLYIWNILDKILTPQIQVKVTKEKCSGYNGEHAVPWKTLVDSGRRYLTFFQSKMFHSHKLEIVLKLGFPLITWCCCFRCSILSIMCMWLYRICVILFQVVFWCTVDWNDWNSHCSQMLVKLQKLQHSQGKFQKFKLLLQGSRAA